MRFTLLASLIFCGFAVASEPSFLVIKSRETSWTHWNHASQNLVDITPAFPAAPSWRRVRKFPHERYFTARLIRREDWESTIAALKRLPQVESVQPDYLLGDPSAVSKVDPALPKLWYLEPLKLFDAWKITTGAGVLIADVESGFDTDHPDLRGQFDLKRSHDYDPKSRDPNQVNDNTRTHGTPVCGIIAAQANNGLFGVGIAHGAKLIGSQVADSKHAHFREEIWTVNAAAAILGSVERGASVIVVEKQVPSLFSSVERVEVIRDAIRVAVEAGIPVIVPAGNFAREIVEEAELPDTGSIVVGATDLKHEPWAMTNFGKRVSVSAPGEGIYSVQENSGEVFDFGGTSAAAAIVAGVVGLVRSANPKLTPLEIRQLLVDTGRPLKGEIGPLIQAGPAVEWAKANFR